MCTRLLWTAEGQPVLVARNMDWTERMGTKLYAMPRGIERQGMTPTNPMKWTSKYGSVVGAVWNAASADGMKVKKMAILKNEPVFEFKDEDYCKARHIIRCMHRNRG